jgi:hypothetical protein
MFYTLSILKLIDARTSPSYTVGDAAENFDAAFQGQDPQRTSQWKSTLLMSCHEYTRQRNVGLIDRAEAVQTGLQDFRTTKPAVRTTFSLIFLSFSTGQTHHEYQANCRWAATSLDQRHLRRCPESVSVIHTSY